MNDHTYRLVDKALGHVFALLWLASAGLLISVALWLVGLL